VINDKINWKPVWTIRRYNSREEYEAGKPYDVSEFKGNLLLNEGIAAMWNLIIGAAETSFAEANAYIGVGDSNTAAAATQTGLQAATNKAYIAMESGYPTRTNQTMTWRAVFDTTDGNYNWREFTVANGNSDAADNMNRVVSDQGTKASGQVWTVELNITLS
jgi:hypothetical protein